MSVLHKITSGFIIQKFDEYGVFIGQEFVAGNVDDTSYENEQGDKVDIPEIDTEVPFTLTQPYHFTDVELVNDCFDKLIAQGGCSTNPTGGCKYRGGCRKCAVGLYIPDEEYYPDLEGGSPDDFSVSKHSIKLCDILRKVGIRPSKMKILQRCHDESSRYKNHIEQLEECRQKVLSALDRGVALEEMNYYAHLFPVP